MSKLFEPGMLVGSYKVLSLLGKGGMGEVFLAEDTRLERKAALKILPAHLVHDPERLRRFTQEARAASALNHPNILTIYEVGESDGAPYIATEFIQGETLRDRLNAARLTLREALDIAVQAASALAAAHEAGIVHRDIKPENIMIRTDGYIKILDFGLAKLTDRTSSGSNDTQAMTMTSPGMVMGTAQYMSPEQARGLALDARSDLFSLGIVLFEMLANKPPFEGDTPSHLIVAIIDKPAPPITLVAPETPPQLESILDKALTKDREERYQTAKDLAVDLRAVRRRLDVETELRRSTPSGGYSAAATPPSGYPLASNMPYTPTGPHSAASAAQPAAAAVTRAPHPVQAVPVTEQPATREPKRTRRKIVRALLILFALWGISKGPFFHRKSKPADRHSVENVQISRITTSGNAFIAAISPDGRYIVYAQSDRGDTSLWMRQTATGSNIQIVPPAQVGYGGMAFSPDGDYLYFLRRSKDQPPALYRMAVLGGSPNLILTNIHSAPTMSPDGKQFAFVRYVKIEQPMKMDIVIANVDGSNQHTIASNEPKELLRSIAWSPDGEWLAASVLSVENGYRGSVVGINVKNGSRKPLANKTWAVTDEIAWTNTDGDLVVLASEQLGSNAYQIWHVDAESKEVKRLSNDLNGYTGVSASMGTDQLVAIQPTVVSNLWVRSSTSATEDHQVTSGSARSDGSAGIAWSPDGKLVYHSRASGMDEIWMSNADGTDAKQLTTSGLNSGPAVTPDSKYIVFTSVRTGLPQLWRMNIDGTDQRQITQTKSAVGPSISPDSKWVLFHNYDSQNNGLFRVPIDGGPIEKMSSSNCAQGWAYSPDGKWILCGVSDLKTSTVPQIGLIPSTGGDVVKTVAVPLVYASGFRFSADSTALTYLYRQKGTTNIWSVPINGGPPRQLTNFPAGRIFTYAYSRDGQQLAMAKGDSMTDVVLMKNSE